MGKDKELEKLEKVYSRFMLKLRMGDGFDKESFNIFCTLLCEFSENWSDRGDIPKQAAMLFIDAYPAMVSASCLYISPLKEEIDMAADEMFDLIKRCVEYASV